MHAKCQRRPTATLAAVGSLRHTASGTTQLWEPREAIISLVSPCGTVMRGEHALCNRQQARTMHAQGTADIAYTNILWLLAAVELESKGISRITSNTRRIAALPSCLSIDASKADAI